MTNGETKVGRPSQEVRDKWQTAIRANDDYDSSDAGKTLGGENPIQSFHRQQLMGELPRIDPDSDHSQFELTETIGQGGMGVVRLARQTSLFRDVALKTVRPDQMGAWASQELLQESWVTGMLEHPNIVPVHALGVDEHESPMLVMKRVEGVSWHEALQDDETLPDSFRAGRDRLEDHLDILIQVCNAIEFAHSRGIIHCDLKPENVMLGSFGEVYVVDWGIAVALEDDGTGRLPLAEEVEDVAGTPAYIAPELAAGAGDKIDRRTDVYLLGAMLHELVTGQARHEAKALRAMLLAAYQSEPVDYPDAVDDKLARICNRATRRERDDRFQTVAQFRQALVDYKRHRDSLRLSDEAGDRLAELEEWVATIRGDDGPEELDEETVTDIHRLYNEARFGFEQALDVWEGNAEAERGLRRAVNTMIAFELHQRNARAAAVLMEEVDEPPQILQSALDRLREQLEAEAEEIERNRRISNEVDIELASRQRSIVFILFGIIYGGLPILNQLAVDAGLVGMTFTDYWTQYAAVCVAAVAVVVPLRERLFENAINARFTVSIFGTIAGLFVVRLTGYLLGLDPAGCIAFENVLLAFSVGMMATAFDSRLWAAPIPFVAGAIGGALYPEWILYFDGASNALALWVFAFAWRESNRGKGAGYATS
jgi:serine/threonine-protein kinase